MIMHVNIQHSKSKYIIYYVLKNELLGMYTCLVILKIIFAKFIKPFFLISTMLKSLCSSIAFNLSNVVGSIIKSNNSPTLGNATEGIVADAFLGCLI